MPAALWRHSNLRTRRSRKGFAFKLVGSLSCANDGLARGMGTGHPCPHHARGTASPASAVARLPC